MSAFILNEKGEVLLTERSSKVLYPGYWCLPGGHVDGGTDWVRTLKNEVLEEVSLEVVSYELVGIYSDPAFQRLTEPTTKEVRDYVNVLFKVTEVRGTAKANDEVSKLGWFTKPNFPTPFLECEKIKTLDGFQFSGEVFVR